MNANSKKDLSQKGKDSISLSGKDLGGVAQPEKGPLSFLSGAVTSLLLAWLSLGLSKQAVGYFMSHQPNYSSPIAQSIASGLKTLVIGMTFLATFTFAFIGLGLTLVFFRSLQAGNQKDST